MQKILNFHIWFANILGGLVIVMMLLIVIDVGGRYFFNSPLLGGVEISKVVLAWIFFLSLSYGLIRGAHIRVELITSRLPPRLRFILDIIVSVMSLGFFILGIYSGWLQFKLSFDVAEAMAAPIWIPFWLAKLAVPAGCFLIALQFGIILTSQLFKFAKGEEL